MWADITSAELGPWMVGLVAFVGLVGGILACAVAIKKLLEPKRPEDNFVTHGEFNEYRVAFKEEVASLKNLMEKHEGYVRSRFHELSNIMATLPLQVKMIQESHAKLESKIDTKMQHTDRILMLVEQHLKDFRPISGPVKLDE